MVDNGNLSGQFVNCGLKFSEIIKVWETCEDWEACKD